MYTELLDTVIQRNMNEELNTVPVFNKKELLMISQPCDLLLVKIPASIYISKPLIIKIGSDLSRIIQGIPYTSIKLIGNNDELLAYGLPVKTLPRNNFGRYSYSSYLDFLHEACLIRHVDMTAEKSKKIIQYSKERNNLDYAVGHLFKSVWNRSFKEKRFQFLKKGESMNIDDINNFNSPLLCSSIVSMSYMSVGLDLDIDIKNVFNIWPKDFLNSKKFKIIGKLSI